MGNLTAWRVAYLPVQAFIGLWVYGLASAGEMAQAASMAALLLFNIHTLYGR